MKSLRTKLAAIAIAVAALIAAPAAAHAYTPGTPDTTVSGTPTPGAPLTLNALSFDANQIVTFRIEGVNGAGITLAATAISSSPEFPATTDGSGNASVQVRLPSNASGTYTAYVTGPKNGEVVTETTTFTVGLPATGGGSGLPATGVDSASLMGVWIGGGVLLLGGLAVTVFAVRRQRQDV